MATIKNFTHRKKTDGLLDIEYHPRTNRTQVVGLLNEEGTLDPSLASPIIQIRNAYREAYDTLYKEFNYDGTLLNSVEVYEDNTKANHLFTKAFSYNSGQLYQVQTIDHVTLKVYTKTLEYIGIVLKKITEGIV